MSRVNSSDTRIINSADDVMELYEGVGEKNAKAGIEIELCFVKPDTPNLDPLTVAENDALIDAAYKLTPGDWLRREPTAETVEVNSSAYGPNDLKKVMDDVNPKIKDLSKSAISLGFKRSLYQDLPHITAQELLKNVVDIPRYNALFNPPRLDMTGSSIYFSVSKSNQVSVSYKDHDHLLDNIRRLYYLAPFLFLAMDNSSGFAEGKQISHQHGMYYRRLLKERNEVPSHLFTAQTGTDFINAHVESVLNGPMFTIYNEDAEHVSLENNEWSSVETLKERGLNTMANYNLSESVLWPDVKIAALRDAGETVNGHRFEARMFGVGIHQHQSALLAVSALAFDDELADRMNFLLKSYGFDQNTNEQNETRGQVTKSYDAAYAHNNQFFDIQYGTGRMADFAKEFADLIENAASMQSFKEELQPLLSICRTGLVDAKVNQMIAPNLDAINALQRSYDPSIFQNPNRCNHMIFEKELTKIAA